MGELVAENSKPLEPDRDNARVRKKRIWRFDIKFGDFYNGLKGYFGNREQVVSKRGRFIGLDGVNLTCWDAEQQ